jgi:hypothetical protein
LQDNIAKYEAKFGEIEIPGSNKANIPFGLSGFKGEA